MASAFRSESRSVQRAVRLPSVEKVRLWPTVDAILATCRADHQEIGDQIVLGALNSVLTAHIVAGHYVEVYRILGKLLGLETPSGNTAAATSTEFPCGDPVPGREPRKPLGRVAR